MNHPESPQTLNSAVVNGPAPEYKQSSRLIFILGGIILLAIGLIAGYYLSQSSKPRVDSMVTPSFIPSPEVSRQMEEWETYSGNNFSFKYPNNWYIDSQGETEDYVRLQNFDPSTAPARGYIPEKDKGNFSISFYDWTEDSNPKTIEELKQEFKKEKECFYVGDPSGERISIKEQSKNIGSILIYSRDTRCSKAPVSTWQKEYFILDGKGYVVKAYVALDVNAGLDHLDQILSTFEFVGNITEEEAIDFVQANYSEVSGLKKTDDNFNSPSGIKVKKDGALWKMVFNQGWGDCEVGCINNQYWYFTVDSEKQITKVGEYKRVFDSKTNSYIETGSARWDFLD